jgi:hypothetical protein
MIERTRVPGRFRSKQRGAPLVWTALRQPILKIECQQRVGTASSRLSDAAVHDLDTVVGCHPRATTVVELGFLDEVGERQVLRWTCRSPRRPPKSAFCSRRHSAAKLQRPQTVFRRRSPGGRCRPFEFRRECGAYRDRGLSPLRHSGRLICRRLAVLAHRYLRPRLLRVTENTVSRAGSASKVEGGESVQRSERAVRPCAVGCSIRNLAGRSGAMRVILTHTHVLQIVEDHQHVVEYQRRRRKASHRGALEAATLSCCGELRRF